MGADAIGKLTPLMCRYLVHDKKGSGLENGLDLGCYAWGGIYVVGTAHVSMSGIGIEPLVSFFVPQQQLDRLRGLPVDHPQHSPLPSCAAVSAMRSTSE